MTRSGKKRRRKRRAKLLEDHAAGLLERVLLWIAACAAAVLRLGGQLLRRLASAFGQASRPTQSLVIAAVAATIVLAYVNRGDLETGRAAVWIDSDVEALARVIRSESGGSPTTHRIHIAWATRNLAHQRGQTVAAMACAPCGRQERGRPVSTRMSARDADRMLAQHILDQPRMFDPTGGATHFINPRVQDELARSGRVPGYKGRTYDKVKRRWKQKYGWEPYYRLGPDLEMWGKKRDRRRR